MTIPKQGRIMTGDDFVVGWLGHQERQGEARQAAGALSAWTRVSIFGWGSVGCD